MNEDKDVALDRVNSSVQMYVGLCEDSTTHLR